MVAFASRHDVLLGLISASLLHLPQQVSAQQCDEYKFNVSACMLYEGSNTMAACQSCLVAGLNQLQGLVPNPQVSSTTSAELLPSNSSSSYCDEASLVLCNILQFDCQKSCLLTSCYNTTTMWATCMAESYAPNCNVTCEDALRNSTGNETDDSSGGGGGGAAGTSGATAAAASWGIVGALVGAVSSVAIAWGGLDILA